MEYTLHLEQYAALARQAVAEGCVLLENKEESLPIRENSRVAIFGRNAFHYYKSGEGSGGLVNTRYVVSILDALKEEKLVLNPGLLDIYENWLRDNPPDSGKGWGTIPFSQKEMPVTEEMLREAKNSDISLVFLGRTAGESQDAKNEPGSFLLTDTELELLKAVCNASKKTVVILNVGNIIDMSWVDICKPQSVLYVWQGGQEGGHGVADVLMGRVNPCGKLTDTIARNAECYPSHTCFGDEWENIYKEDIYVGYRYFETFARDKVLYPFGFGKSYTDFTVSGRLLSWEGMNLTVSLTVRNIGSVPGKEVAQVYVEAPQGSLGNPLRKLIAFQKTDVLAPGQSQSWEITIPKSVFAVFDDRCDIPNANCFLLEEGRYHLFAGNSVQAVEAIGSFTQELLIVERLSAALTPEKSFARLRPVLRDGILQEGQEQVLENTSAKLPPIPLKHYPEYRGDQGYKLGDVFDGKVTMDAFLSQLSDEDLIPMMRGEGMCSLRVTPGTAGAFGGVTDKLASFGIPAACCSDGPSGIRMDCGTKAFSLPNGTALGCTFNPELVEALFEMLGKELRLNKIDSLLGPGMNIHRNPLNGRNFEYISEDPLLTGKIAAAQIRGMGKYKIQSTIKHFCGNNQETGRRSSNSVISCRALREIYLKGFEIVVKEANCTSVMTTYGAVNGLWTAGSEDLLTRILRHEWGFRGIVMSDWWADTNYRGKAPDRSTRAPMILAQNDLCMCTADCADPNQDDMAEQYRQGLVTRDMLCRNAENILNFLLRSPAILRSLNRLSDEEKQAMLKLNEDEDITENLRFYTVENGELVIPGDQLNPKHGKSDVLEIMTDAFGIYDISVTMKSDLDSLAQLPISVFLDNTFRTTITVQGSQGKTVVRSQELGRVFGRNHYLKLYYGADGMDIQEIRLRYAKPLERPKQNG